MNTKASDLELLGSLTGEHEVTRFDSGGPPPPDDGDPFSAAWCTDALRAGGVLADGVEVTEVKEASLGADTPGFLGLLCRLHLDYSEPDAGPMTVVAKRSSPEEFNRAIAHAMGFYEREYRSYRELATTMPVRMPTHFYSALDGDRFALLIEDLGAARCGRQSDVTTVADMEAVLDELAALHNHFATPTVLDGFGWIPPLDANAAVFNAALETRWAGFVAHAASFRPEAVAAVEALLGRLDEVLARLAADPVTLVHGDFRIDNVMFDAAPDPTRPLFIDWQAVSRGQGVFDVAQIVGLSFDPATRRSVERGLLERYAAATGHNADDLYDGYRLGLIYAFVMGIAQTDMDTAQVGSDTTVWITRASEAVADHGLPSTL